MRKWKIRCVTVKAIKKKNWCLQELNVLGIFLVRIMTLEDSWFYDNSEMSKTDNTVLNDVNTLKDESMR